MGILKADGKFKLIIIVIIIIKLIDLMIKDKNK